MSEIFNQKSSVPGKIPSGLFNTMFGFQSGSWARDAANTKFLALDEGEMRGKETVGPMAFGLF